METRESMDFHRRFKLLTYGVALWAFLTLAVLVNLGQLHLPVTIAFLSILLIAVLRDDVVMGSRYLRALQPLHNALSFNINRYVWLVVSVAAFLFALYGWFVVGERMYSVTYLFFYLELNKLLTAKTNRDYIQIYALTFFHMLAASVSTDSFVFGFMLIVYLYLILESLTTFTIKRDVEAAFESDKNKKLSDKTLFRNLKPYRLEESDSNTLRKVMSLRIGSFRLLGFRAILIGAVIVLGMAIFWVIPRTSSNNFVNPGLSGGVGSGRKSGFADSVEFGGVGEIQLDPTIIMRAAPFPEDISKRPFLLRIRGTSLDLFADNRWSKSTMLIQYSFIVERREANFENHVAFTSQDLIDRSFRAKLTLEPETSRYTFMLDQPYKIIFDSSKIMDIDRQSRSVKQTVERYDKLTYDSYGIIQDDEFLNRLIEVTDPHYETIETENIETSSLTFPFEKQSQKPEIVYVQNKGIAESLRDKLLEKIKERNREAEEKKESVDRDEIRRNKFIENYLRFPQQVAEEKLQEVSFDWIGETKNPLRQARIIEQTFKNDFQYSLENSFSNRPDHIEYFLTEARSGHCEYFATTMVLMLRSIDIPARIVNGYITDEWNESQGRYIVRQEHAHSWVEVYDVLNGSWVTFDPTPSSGIGRNRTSITWYHRFSSVFDSMRMYWHENVVDYNINDQRNGFFTAIRLLREFRSKTAEGASGLSSLFSNPTTAKPTSSTFIFLAVIISFTFIIVIIVIKRKSIWAFLRKGKQQSQYTVPVDLKPYVNMMKELEKVWPRKSGQTPMQYAKDISEKLSTELRDFIPVTESYYRARYDESLWSQDDQKALNNLESKWRKIKSSVKKQKPSASAIDPQST